MTFRTRLRSHLRSGGAASFFDDSTLDMNFATGAYRGKLPSDLTVSRTGTTGYADTSTGTLTSFAINTARITDLGLLVEEARTNLCLQSQTLQTTWTTAAASVTTDQTAAPDGTVTADLVTEDGTSAAHGLNQTVTIATNAAYACSVYVKPNGRTWFRINMDDGTGSNGCQAYYNCSGAGAVGTVTNLGTGASSAGSIQSLANGWYRCILTGTPATVSTGSVRILLRVTTGDNVATHAGNSTSGAYVWGAQLEAGAFATSYIPTTTGSQARAADLVSLAAGAAFSDWFTNAAAGTFYVEFNQYAAGGGAFGRMFVASDGSTNNFMSFEYGGPTNNYVVTTATVNQATLTFVTPSFNTTNKAAMRYASNDFHAALNGTLGTADTGGSVPSVTQLHLGNRFDNPRALDGYVRRFAYIPSAVTNATLQAMTS